MGLPANIEYGEIIVFNDESKTYRTFSSTAELLASYDTLRHSHEVIHGWRPQKVRFDIDAKASELSADAGFDLCKQIIDLALHLYYNEFAHQILRNYTEEDFLLTSACNGQKTSYHVIAPFFGATNSDVFYFCSVVREQITLKKFIDDGVYKTVQNFRMLEQAKSSDPGRPKLPLRLPIGTTKDAVRLAALIGNYDRSKCNPFTTGRTVITPAGNPEIVGDIDTRKFEEIVAPYISAHTLRNSYNGRYFYDRVRPSHCELCDRVHEKDNTLIITVAATPGNPVYLRCRRAEAASKYIGRLSDPEDPGLSSLIERGRAFNFTLFSKDEGLLYSEPQMRPFDPEARTLLVRAPMKLGKTKALIAYIKTHHPESTAIFVTFRQTFSRALESSLRDSQIEIANYMDIPEKQISLSEHRRVIIQVESLHRLRVMGTTPPDLLVMDECESIFEQFSSGNIRDINSAFATLEWLIKRSTTLICMDANLGPRTRQMMLALRHSFRYHLNTFQNARDDTYYFIKKKQVWYAHLMASVTAGSRIAVFFNSLTEAKVLEHALMSELPDKAIALYSSEMSTSTKSRHFSDVHEHWSKLDVLICTPTVSAGISFELPHFDYVYAYFTDQSCSVETSRQMLGRIRNVTRHAYYIHLNVRTSGSGGLPTDLAQIRTFLNTRRNLLSDLTPIVLSQPWHYDGLGRPVIEETPLHLLSMLNIQHTNLSRTRFAARLISQLLEIGAKVLEYQDTTDLTLLADLKSIRNDIKQYAAARIASAPTLTDDQAASITAALSSGTTEVRAEEVAALQRYNIVRLYGVPPSDVTTSFVEMFGSYTDRAHFRNLREVSLIRSGGFTPAQTLEVIRATNQTTDISPSHIYERHLVATRLIAALGFTSVFDQTTQVASEVFISRLSTLRSDIKTNYSYYAFIINEKLPTLTEDWHSILRIVNRIISLYSAHIKRKPNSNYILSYKVKFDPYLKIFTNKMIAPT